MLVWLPEKIYKKVKNESQYNLLIEQLKSTISDDELTDHVWIKNEKILDLMIQLIKFIDNLEMSKDEKLLWRINKITGEDQLNYVEEGNKVTHLEIDQKFYSVDDAIYKLDEIQKEIDELENSDEKIDCEIYCLQLKALFVMEKEGYYSKKLKEMRERIIFLYESSTTKNFESETIFTYYFNLFDLFIINMDDEIKKIKKEEHYEFAKKYFEKLKYFTETKKEELYDHSKKIEKNTRYFYEDLESNKIYFCKFFYEKIFSSLIFTTEQFLEIEELIYNHYLTNNFKNKNIHMNALKFIWVRMIQYFSYNLFDKFLNLNEELSNTIINYLREKKKLIKSLNYYADGNVTTFLTFLKYYMVFEKEIIVDIFKKEQRMTNLNLTKKEILVLNDDKFIESNRTNFIPTITWMKKRIYG